jgi:uncharacterized protein (DUF433 family)
MGHASSSTTSHPGHASPVGGGPHVGSKPSHREVNALEFGMFADTLRQDLSPLSLLEHVLAERVVLAAWRLHVVSLAETDAARAGAALGPVTHEAAQVEADLSSAIALLEAARKVQHPRWGRAEHPASPAPAEPAETAAHDEPGSALRFDPDAADHANEWAHIDDDPDECDVEEEDEDHEEEMPARWQDRLVFDENVSKTSPVVKGTWITVSHIVSLIVDGWSWADILRSHPELTEDDVRMCLAYSVEQDDRGEY